MAKKEKIAKPVLERVYNVPLRKEFQKAPRWRRTKKAVKALRQFISKHMKSDKVVISRYVNLHLWKNGIKNPPHHVKVNAVKDDKPSNPKIATTIASIANNPKRLPNSRSDRYCRSKCSSRK